MKYLFPAFPISTHHNLLASARFPRILSNQFFLSSHPQVHQHPSQLFYYQTESAQGRDHKFLVSEFHPQIYPGSQTGQIHYRQNFPPGNLVRFPNQIPGLRSRHILLRLGSPRNNYLLLTGYHYFWIPGDLFPLQN